MLSLLPGPTAKAGVIFNSTIVPDWGDWIPDYGIQSSGGYYFGYTSDPLYALTLSTIPLAPKFPNVDFISGYGGAEVLAVDAGLPGELYSYLTYSPNGYNTELTATVPVGTTLTFIEGDLGGWYDYSTLYHDIDHVPTPFEEFRPLQGDGPDQYVLDEVGAVDLVVFSFFTGGSYPAPGKPSFPILVHINVVPEPTAVLVFLAGMSVFLRKRQPGCYDRSVC